MTPISDVLLAWQVQYQSEEPEPYDVEGLIRRKQAAANLREAKRSLARAAMRNVRSEVANG